MHWWVLVLLTGAAVVSAGCFEQYERPIPPPAGLEPGTWQVGHYWDSFLAFHPGTYPTWGDLDLVVVDEDEGHWYLEADSPALAWAHERYETGVLGQVRKSDLAVMQEGEWIQYFDFPLEEGKRWQTVWNGEQVEVSVVNTTSRLVFLEAHSLEKGVLRAEYQYSESSGWFRKVEMFDDQGGSAFRMYVQKLQDDPYKGPLVHWDAHLVAHGEETGQDGTLEAEFVVTEEVDNLWFEYGVDCADAQLVWHFSINREPDSLPLTMHRDGDRFCMDRHERWLYPDPPAGQWSQRMLFTSMPNDSTVFMETWTRTLVERDVSFVWPEPEPTAS